VNIISHRGLWLDQIEKNSLVAFERSFSMGFGTETDIRDHLGQLVISHDPALVESISLIDFLVLYKKMGNELPLALNIKSDGIAPLLKTVLKNYEIKSYFTFDMSVPELVRYNEENILFYTRHSDIEKNMLMLDQSSGIWLDSFGDDSWIDTEFIKYVLSYNKPVCIVSSELHGRDPMLLWYRLKLARDLLDHGQFTLCTDLCMQAKNYFK